MGKNIKVQNSMMALEKLANIKKKYGGIEFNEATNKIVLKFTRNFLKYKLIIVDENTINVQKVWTSLEKRLLAFWIIFFLMLMGVLLSFGFSLAIIIICSLLFIFIYCIEFVFSNFTNVSIIKNMIDSPKWDL
jgi:hypothetical protein